MPATDIQPGKPNRGATYMATCPACGFRKRLNLARGERDGVKGQYWQFWCRCGYAEVICTDAEIKREPR
jgi:hypothetical protein